MNFLTLLMFVVPALTGNYSPYNIRMFSGVKGNKEGVFIRFSSNREEFISRKSGNEKYSVIEYRVIVSKGKNFLGGDIYVDTLKGNNADFTKLIFYPSPYDTLDVELLVKDRLSDKTIRYRKKIIRKYKGNKTIKILSPLYKDNNGLIIPNFENAGTIIVPILNSDKIKHKYHIELVGDSLLYDSSGFLEKGYNIINVKLNSTIHGLLKKIRISIPDSVNLSVVYNVTLVDTEKTESYMERVNQLIYIATPEEIKKLKSAPKSERDSLWNDFWEKRDPVPTTKKNEAEIEYFKRVKYANEHFTSYKPGWKTDRGMIYIKYGPPDDIESFPYNIDTEPYEIWYYNDLNRRFIFVDKYGWGDYQLVN